MRHISTIVVAFLTPFLGVVPAFASATDWLEVNGGRVRLVTSGLPDSSGLLNGALEIDLEPGWKTYWRDPGDAGVPPQIDIARSSNIAWPNCGFRLPSVSMTAIRNGLATSIWSPFPSVSEQKLRISQC